MMKPEVAVLDIQGQYRIHTEFYRAENAENTIILVNGSMATTASFAQTLKNLHPHLNVVLYDQPYAGKSKAHNRHQKMLTRELEAQVLLELIEHFDANYLLSFSWGGTAALTALANTPRRIEKAVISSFSPLINEAMRDYLERGRHCLAARNRTQVGNLVNDTLGKHLPPLFKRFNFRHVSTLAEHEYAQMHFHINHVLNSDQQGFLTATQGIEIPVLFINGAWDEYTVASDAQHFAQPIANSRFICLENTGHFLDMEHKSASHNSKAALLDFLQPAQPHAPSQSL
ncbi:Pimeloyl-ACP methyl ester carboxylesterase [Pseudomonas deceptionensis]|jgi:rhamnosyltransferase subunit A|uniref:Pimeloyl-ACP methyl ester carboxylesterase n=2 Tax=Pseudomonas deceptionensis TaxID=882211 RepID=A0A1H5P4U0_PSEDM|nr:Pimeloyl-ACP methyl ester carboxylesterase [Pseudomonas deceptionensis]